MPSLPLPQGKPLDVPRTIAAGAGAAPPGADRGGRAALRRGAGGAAGSFRRAADARRHQARRAASSRRRCASSRAAMQLRPNSPQVLLNHGLVLNAMNRHEEALASFDEALKHKGRFAEAHNNRGSVLIALGRCEEALDSFKRAIAIKPDYAEAFYNQGNALRLLDRHDDALKSYDRAHRAAPELRQGALQPRRRCSTASAARPRRSPCYDRALAIDPNFAEAMLNRCGALRALKRIDETLQTPRRAAGGASELCRGALHARHADGRLQPADRGGRELREGGGAQARLQQGALGVVHGGAADPLRRRGRDRPRSAPTTSGGCARSAPTTRPAASPATCPRASAWRSRSSSPTRAATIAICNACSAASRRGSWPTATARPKLAPPPAPGEPVRVGIVSGFFYQHSVWKVGVRGWVTRARPEALPGVRLPHRLQAGCRDRARPAALPPLRAGAALDRAVAADHPRRPAARAASIPEIGMNHEASELAALRLAPVQCSYIGHPQTSGFPTIDCFLSGELIEPPDGAGPLFGKAGEAAQHRLPLRAAGARRRASVTPAGTRAAPGRDRLLVRAIAVQISAAVRRRVPAHRPRGRRLPVRVHPPFRPRTSPSCSRSGSIAPSPPPASRPTTIACSCDAMSMNRFAAASAPVRRHARQHRLVGRQHHARGAGPGSAGRHLRGRPDARPGQRRHAADDGHAGGRSPARIDDYVALAVRIGRDPPGGPSSRRASRSDKHRLYRDRTCIAALRRFPRPRRARRPQL